MIKRRWWRLIKIKKMIFFQKNLLKILKIQKWQNVFYYVKLNKNLIFINFKILKRKFLNLCYKTCKFKKTFKSFPINRWELSKTLKNNNVPNIKKFVW